MRLFYPFCRFTVSWLWSRENVIKILPDANARQFPGAENQATAAKGDAILTQVVQVQNVAAAQLVPILRPLIPQYGHLAAHPASNMLIISDRAANVERMVRIIRRIDQAGDEDYEVIRLEHASATEIQRIVTALNQTARGEGAASPPTTVVADERTNSLLVSGDRNDRLRIRALITHLDTPLEEGGNTRVRYLRYAEAATLAEKLQSQFTQPGGAPQPGQPGPETQVWADEQTNALIITAPPKVMTSMLSVIDKLDIRRMQVLVEAIIVEVMSERAADLGVTWAVFNDEVVAGVTDFPTTTGALGLGGAIAGAEDGAIPDLSALAGQGLTGAVGRLSDSGYEFCGGHRGPGGRRQLQYSWYAGSGHHGQRGSRDQSRSGSPLRDRLIYQYRHGWSGRQPFPDYRTGAGRSDTETDASDQ